MRFFSIESRLIRIIISLHEIVAYPSVSVVITQKYQSFGALFGGHFSNFLMCKLSFPNELLYIHGAHVILSNLFSNHELLE